MSIVQVLPRMGALWQQRMNSMKEYEVVRDGNAFASGFSNNFVFASEYDLARSHLDQLMNQYRDIPFTHVFSGNELANEGGVCFHICNDFALPPLNFDSDRYRHDLLSDLTLARGIGLKKQRQLKAHGYATLADLIHNPKFRAAASRAIVCLSQGKSGGIMEFIGSRHPKSHPLALGTAGFHEPEDFVFIDIETLGLFSRPITLFGVGIIKNGSLSVHQYLLRDIAEEPAALSATMNHLSGRNPALVTFNGKSFDMPYILDRLAFYGMMSPTRAPHYDVLHFSRNQWKGQFDSCRLSTLEKEILGVERSGDIPGQMVPEFYEMYLKTGNCGPLIPIVEHNRQDVVSLALLFFRLLGESYGR
jgi:uncharacterized protein